MPATPNETITRHLQVAVDTITDANAKGDLYAVHPTEVAIEVARLDHAIAEIRKAAELLSSAELAHFACGKCGLDVYMRPQDVAHVPENEARFECPFIIMKPGTRSDGTELHCPGHGANMTYWLEYVDGATVQSFCAVCGSLAPHTHNPCAKMDCENLVWVPEDYPPPGEGNRSTTGLYFCDDCWDAADNDGKEQPDD